MAETASTTYPAPKNTGIWQWFWRGRAIEAVTAEISQLPKRQRELLSHARVALELGDRALDPIEPLRAGSSLPLSVSLYREAAHAALLAQSSQPAALDVEQAFASVDGDTLRRLAGDDDAFDRTKQALLSKTLNETSAEHPDVQRKDALALQKLAAGLIELQLGPERKLGQLRVERWVRIGLALVALVVVLVGGSSLVRMLSQGPDLAEGLPLVPSSNDPSVRAETRNFLFHTVDEENPWVEIDLKRPATFSVVEVKNRRDCCQDRALPGLIEVSTDHQHWKEVSRRTESFNEWRAVFKPTTARYVRFRVGRRSVLHLAGIAVRPN